MNRALTPTQSTPDEIRPYEGDLHEILREKREIMEPDHTEGLAVAIVIACACAVFVGCALILAGWLL